MKYFSFVLITIFLFTLEVKAQDKLDLSGKWELKLDPKNEGYAAHWWDLPFNQKVNLPGSLAENNIGDDISLETPWTGDIIDSSFFNDKSFVKYRSGEIKVPFWLSPNKYYKGVAWYKRTFDLPKTWLNKHLELNLERCHWETSVYINGSFCGTQNSLIAPHTFDISKYLKEKNNIITIRVNNDYIIPIGPNSSSITDHTQTNWNGIIGEMTISAYEKSQIKHVQLFPNIENSSVTTKFNLINLAGKNTSGKISLKIDDYPELIQDYNLEKTKTPIEIIYKIPNAKLWDEFNTNLYTINLKLLDENGNVLSSHIEKFGMREIAVNNGRISINNKPIFLRGDVDCAGFPLTGYPSMDKAEWERIFKTIKSYGLNHLRFHSWCPPEVAFNVADQLGVYLYAESPLWANFGSAVGTGGEIDDFIYAESERMIAEYGNHPSFIMMSYGNEPAGANQNVFFTDYVNYFKSKDKRRLYTSAAGWPQIQANEFHITHTDVRIQGWGEGNKSVINAKNPSFNYDWSKGISKFNSPVISHEIGQWCAYPNFKEMGKYKGILKAKNFETFKETLEENGMGNQAEEFLYASGRLQTLCYKADIEAALRTPKFGGFQLLGLHDFPGQGTALVGALDAFWESKGYTTPAEYRTFCNSTVLLAKFPKLIYTNNEILDVPLEISHFGDKKLSNSIINWQIVDANNKIYYQGSFKKEEIIIGDPQFVGDIKQGLSKIKTARQLKLKVSMANSDISNFWDIWVYPNDLKINEGNVLVVDKLDDATIDKIKNGQSVLYLAHDDIKDTTVEIGFSSIFWNTAWTRNQAPHTMGLAIQANHPLFNYFPTEVYSNYQWFDLITHSQVMILKDFDKNNRPLLQPIDTWFKNRKLSIGFETKIGKGKLMVCSIDLNRDLENRIVAKQFKYSLLNYMNSTSFSPKSEMDIQKIKALFK